SLRHDGAAAGTEFRSARHHAGDGAPQGRVQDADLAGAGRRPAAPTQALTASGPAQLRGAEHVARYRRRRNCGIENRRRAVTRNPVASKSSALRRSREFVVNNRDSFNGAREAVMEKITENEAAAAALAVT